jgi:hypothetical protein
MLPPRLTASDMDEPLRPRPISSAPSARSAVDLDGWPGLARLVGAALALSLGGYGAGYIVDVWPGLLTPLFVMGPPITLAFGVWLVRKGIANPYVRKYERWCSRAQDRKEQAEQANIRVDQLSQQIVELDDLLDQVAHHVTGVEDTNEARRLLHERLDRQRAGKRRGRPPRTPNGMSYEEGVEIGRKIRQLTTKGMSWSNAAKRYGMSVETAHTRVQWANDEDRMKHETA